MFANLDFEGTILTKISVISKLYLKYLRCYIRNFLFLGNCNDMLIIKLKSKRKTAIRFKNYVLSLWLIQLMNKP